MIGLKIKKTGLLVCVFLFPQLKVTSYSAGTGAGAGAAAGGAAGFSILFSEWGSLGSTSS